MYFIPALPIGTAWHMRLCMTRACQRLHRIAPCVMHMCVMFHLSCVYCVMYPSTFGGPHPSYARRFLLHLEIISAHTQPPSPLSRLGPRTDLEQVSCLAFGRVLLLSRPVGYHFLWHSQSFRAVCGVMYLVPGLVAACFGTVARSNVLFTLQITSGTYGVSKQPKMVANNMFRHPSCCRGMIGTPHISRTKIMRETENYRISKDRVWEFREERMRGIGNSGKFVSPGYPSRARSRFCEYHTRKCMTIHVM